MQKILKIVLAFSFALPVMANANDSNAYPEWVIKTLKANAETKIYRTQYLGKTVFYIPPKCCDIPSKLLDEDAKLICYPSGGFAGGDGKCPDFKFPLTDKPITLNMLGNDDC